MSYQAPTADDAMLQTQILNICLPTWDRKRISNCIGKLYLKEKRPPTLSSKEGA